ncbi:unnamed protein product, partial [marine sediment metagenome]
PRLLFEGKKDNILAYPLYEIIHKNSKGYIVGDTNYGKQDLTLVTKIAGAEQVAKLLKDNYEEWEKPKHMMIMIKNADLEFHLLYIFFFSFFSILPHIKINCIIKFIFKS